MKYRMRDIENFAATANCLTMGEAARKLEISQPALTESIQRLESDAGSSLFYRSRSGIQLTPAGRHFLKKVHALLHSVRELELETETQEGKVFDGQSLALGCHSSVASYVLPEALSHLKEVAPDYQITLHHDLSRNIQTQIQKGQIDLGIVINPVRVPDLVISRVGSDTVAVWSAKDRKTLDTLIWNPDLFQSQSILKKWKNAPARLIPTDSLELIYHLTRQGVGYGILPARVVGLYEGALHQVPHLPTYQDEIALVHRPEFGRTKAEKIVLETLKKKIASIK